MYATILMDVEDFIDPDADDAAKACADILTQEGVQATMCIVGEKARRLKSRGRFDVIESLLKHDIGFHTDYHSVHPTIAEFLQNKGWDDGVLEALEQEAPGVRSIEEAFGVTPSCWGGPGNTWGPQICEAMKRLGVPAFVYGFTSVPEGEVHRFEGILAFPEGHYFSDSVFHLTPSVDRHLAKIVAGLEVERAGGQFWSQVFIGHPTRILHDSFWDSIFEHGANPIEEDRRPVERKNPEDLRIALDNFRRIVRVIKAVPGIRLRTIREMNEMLSPVCSSPISLSEQEEVWPALEAKLQGMTDWPILPKQFDVSSICEVARGRLHRIERLELTSI